MRGGLKGVGAPRTAAGLATGAWAESSERLLLLLCFGACCVPHRDETSGSHLALVLGGRQNAVPSDCDALAVETQR
jgi:hypothetical protein